MMKRTTEEWEKKEQFIESEPESYLNVILSLKQFLLKQQMFIKSTLLEGQKKKRNLKKTMKFYKIKFKKTKKKLSICEHCKIWNVNYELE